MDILFKLVPPPAQIPPSAVPMVYPLKPRDSYFNEKVYIFNIPRANSVGSLNIHYSSLTAIEFERNGRLDYNRIKRKRDIDIMDGKTLMLPENKMLGWRQGRGYQLIDIEKRKVRYWSISDDIHDNLNNVNILDESSMLFAFEVITTDKKKYQVPPLEDSFEDWYVILKVIDLSEKDQKYVTDKMVDISKEDIFWTVHHGVIYHYCKKINHLFAYNKELNPVKSPLIDSFNKVAVYGAGSVLGPLLFHPSLPFTIIGIGANEDPEGIIPLYYIALIDNDECKFIPMFGGKLEQKINKFFFSPDGNWLVFQYSTEYQGSPHYYFMKVNPQNPVFLEPPRYLGKTAAKHGRGITTAWSTNPTSFVVSDGILLYRWDMEKADKGVLQNSK